MIPIVEETLRWSGATPHREQIIEKFMNGAPRVAVVRGGEDHPPALGSGEMTRRIVRQLWQSGAIPFQVTQSFPCEDLSRATGGAHYALLARNFCTANLAGQMESHGYDGAIVTGVCDKMMVGNLRALIEADMSRQRRRGRPVFAMFIPPVIARDVYPNEEEKRKFEPLKARLPENERHELNALLRLPLNADVYARMNAFLERCLQIRLIQEAEKDILSCGFLKCSAVYGANCASSDNSMIHRMMLASLGIVPRQFDILIKSPTDEQIHETTKRLLMAIQKRERRVSIAGLTRSNLVNAAAVWSATGGHPGWLLHLSYLANAIGKNWTVEDVVNKATSVPQILAMNGGTGNSSYSMGLEKENGGNSGIDTLMRTLAEKRFVEDRAPTLDGPWSERIMDARSANGTFVYSTMTPFSRNCGLFRIHGNFCDAAVLRVAAQRAQLEGFDRKVYLAVSYLGVNDMFVDFSAPELLLERLKRKIDRDDLYFTWRFNQQSLKPDETRDNGQGTPGDEWSKNQLWDFLIGTGTLRLMIVVAGSGPHAAGMPEIQLRCPTMPKLETMSVIVTDGRVSSQHDGVSISHIVPESYDGGGLGSVRTGDWIYLDLANREIQVVCRARNSAGFKPLAVRELLSRPELKKHVREVARRRLDLLPSVRVLMDHISSAESGVSPTTN